MKDRIRIITALAVGFAAYASAPSRSYAQQTPTTHHHYVVVDMGSLGGPGSIVYEQGTRSLNNQGTFTGAADTPNLDPNNPQNPCSGYPDNTIDPYIQHVFRWELGEKADLGRFPGGTSSCSQWINDRGWIVGSATDGKVDLLAGFPEAHATLWRNDEILDLGTFGGSESYAWSVNDLGQVVGFASNTVPDQSAGNVFAWGATQTHAFLWQNGRMQDLGTLGGTFGYPNMINGRGQIAGFSDVAGDLSGHAFLWESGVLKDLGTHGGTVSEARCINDARDAAGYATFPGDQVVHATLWTNGKIVDLGATT